MADAPATLSPDSAITVYIANGSRQHRDFQYQIVRKQEGKEATRSNRHLNIPAGSEVKLTISRGDWDAILKQHEHYGLHKFNERVKAFNQLLWSENEILLSDITEATELNDRLATKTADDMQAATAAAIVKNQEEVAQGAGVSAGVRADLEVTDVPPGGSGTPTKSRGVEAVSEGTQPKRSTGK